ncbi:MAG: hypothetical protein KGL67_01580 [Patescibacteria group bacterium]|nr:hypothetical protein [Patescibacteria group bacterium]
MDKEFESIIKAVKNIKLTESEKALMRTNLLDKVSPVQNLTHDNIVKSNTSRIYYYYQNIKKYNFMNNKSKFVPAFIVILIIIITGGTSAFAERAVPGDLLYGIKTSVNEPVAGIFALTKEEKTEWRERLVERRLKEAQKLVARNNFDESKRVILETKIKSQIDEFNTSANELALEKDKSRNSSDLNIRLQASLRAYQDVLKNLSEQSNTNTETKNETDKLVSTLEESKNKEMDGQAKFDLNLGVNEGDSSATSTTPDSASALGKQTAAENLLNLIKLSYQKEKLKLSTNIQTQIDSKLALAETSLQEGKTFMTSSDYANAINRFQLVITDVNSIKLLMLSNVIKGEIEDDMGVDNGGDIEDDNLLENENHQTTPGIESPRSSSDNSDFHVED